MISYYKVYGVRSNYYLYTTHHCNSRTANSRQHVTTPYPKRVIFLQLRFASINRNRRFQFPVPLISPLLRHCKLSISQHMIEPTLKDISVGSRQPQEPRVSRHPIPEVYRHLQARESCICFSTPSPPFRSAHFQVSHFHTLTIRPKSERDLKSDSFRNRLTTEAT